MEISTQGSRWNKKKNVNKTPMGIQWKCNWDKLVQGTNARKVNCGHVYSAYILKPVLSCRNLLTRIDASVFV